jgi:hypothetical protein
MAKDKHRVDRNAQYQALRDAGFSSAEANRLKGASPEKVAAAIRSGALPEKVVSKITQGYNAPPTSKGYKEPPAPKPTGHKARGLEYRHVEDHEKKYLDRYSFVVSYRYKRSDTTLYITITSPTNMYTYEVLEAAAATLQENSTGKYKVGAIAWSSLKVEYAVFNPEGVGY